MISLLTLIERETRLQYKWKSSTRNGEYKGECPICGGKDRLMIQPNHGTWGWFECRQCEDFRGSIISFCEKFLNMENKAEIYKYLDCAKSKTQVSKSIKIDKPLIVEYKHIPTKIIKPTQIWIDEITKIANISNKALHDFQPLIEYLNNRGITTDTIDEFKIGYNEEFIKYPAKTISDKIVYIPPGITIPFIHHDNFNRVLKLKIKSHIQGIKENPEHRFSIIPSGQNGLSHILRNTDNFIIAEAELDMYTLYSQLGANFSYIASGNDKSLPDNYLHPIVKKCSNLLICHDNDAAGANMYFKWKKEYPNAIARPVPSKLGKDKSCKDPGEAFGVLNFKEYFSVYI